MSDLDFFILEKYNTYHVLNPRSSTSLLNIQKRRVRNYEEEKPLNSGLPFTEEEVHELKMSISDNKSFDAILRYFQRSPFSLIFTLTKYAIPLPEGRVDFIIENVEDENTVTKTLSLSEVANIASHRVQLDFTNYYSVTLDELNVLHKKYSSNQSEIMDNNQINDLNLDDEIQDLHDITVDEKKQCMEINALLDIKKYLESLHLFDMIAVQSGLYYNLYNEHAEKFNSIWGYKTYYRGENILSGFPVRIKNHVLERLENEGLTYAFVTQYKEEKGLIIRTIDESSYDDILGKSFILPIKKSNRKKNKKGPSDTEIIFLNAILNNADPFTGEVLSDDSIWKHPKIISDIKKYFEKYSI